MNPLQILASFIYPPRCVFCGNICGIGMALCGECTYIKAEIPALTPAVIGPQLSGAVSACEYDGQAAKALLRLKRMPDKRTARFFTGLIAERVRARWPDIAFTLVVAVPLNPASRKERGYNQAMLIAGEYARMLGLPVTDKLLARRDSTRVQHRLSLKERFANAAESYYAAQPGRANGETVLLIDDILTTGATALACAAALMDAGAKAVYFASAAYTRKRPDDRNRNLV